uniref:Uncharacterized protein n=1 Tax=Ciona intestinalis TaxID=7719 RepID=H2XU40_CIOIN
MLFNLFDLARSHCKFGIEGLVSEARTGKVIGDRTDEQFEHSSTRDEIDALHVYTCCGRWCCSVREGHIGGES